MSRRNSPWLIILVLLLAPAPGRGQEVVAPSPFEPCQARFLAQPQEFQSGCFSRTARSHGLWQEAVTLIESNLARHPQHPWLLFNLAQIELDQKRYPAAAVAFGALVEVFSQRREPLGQFYSHLNRYKALLETGELDEAGQELEGAQRAALAMEDEARRHEIELYQIEHQMRRGEDLQRALEEILHLASRISSESPYQLRLDCLRIKGEVAYKLGRSQVVRDAYGALAQLSRSHGDSGQEALALYNLAVLETGLMPTPARRRRTADLALDALEAAQRARHVTVEAQANLLIGLLLEGEDARSHLRRCVEVAQGSGDENMEALCLRSLSQSLLDEDPVQAQELARRALDRELASESPWPAAYTWGQRLRVRWATASRQEALEDSLAILSFIEALRDLQYSEGGQAEFFAVWTEAYYWLSGRLLRSAEDGSPEDLAQAFAVVERMRARVLLDALNEAGIAGPDLAPGERQRRESLLRQRVEVRKRLLDPHIGASARRQALAGLGEVEHELDNLQAAGRASPPDTRQWGVRFTGQDEIRSALAPHQALLSFQVGVWENLYGDFAGGAWLLVTTLDGNRLYRIPDRVWLEPAVAYFRHTFESRNGDEVQPSVTLYQALLEPALGELPAEVRQLIVVPDGVLHLLPFGALRPEINAPPLALELEITVVPSATLWRRLQDETLVPSSNVALALADPALPPGETEAVGVEREPQRDAYPPLPSARREGAAVVRHLGRPSRLLAGGEASEESFLELVAQRPRVLHFAAHAVLDSAQPHRSAVLLSPGAPGYDGLLTAAEIAELDLEGSVVVLSACRSAAGRVLHGEGVLSLARAFFQARAHTVVGTLWPLRDDEAAELFETFYAHLGRGQSVARALKAAQTESIAKGRDAALWASVTVLGDGDLVPLPGGRPRGVSGAVALAGLVAIVALSGAWWWRRRRRP